MAEFNTIDNFDVENKTVLVRIDINAPVDPSSGIILDDTRLKLHAQTVKELSKELKLFFLHIKAVRVKRISQLCPSMLKHYQIF